MAEVSQDLRRMPWWMPHAISLVFAMTPAAVGYGMLKANVETNSRAIDEAKGRIEKVEAKNDEREREVYKAIAEMRVALGSVQLDVARVLAILKR